MFQFRDRTDFCITQTDGVTNMVFQIVPWSFFFRTCAQVDPLGFFA